MPERSFGRTIRYRRTNTGLSQAKLGELVGRSPSTIRSWERDRSVPNEPAVLDALAAVLAIDRSLLYNKAGVEPVQVETSPTVEEALATLVPASEQIVTSEEGDDDTVAPDSTDAALSSDEGEPIDDSESIEEAGETAAAAMVEVEPTGDDAGLTEDTTGAQAEDEVPTDSTLATHPEPPAVLTPPPPAPLPRPVSPTPSPGYVVPRDNLVYSPAAARAVEPSYIEDGSQRQLYRIRGLATVVFIVALVVVLIWASSNAWESLTSWWSDFFGNLRL